MDVKITFYRMLIFSIVTGLLTVSIFAMPATTTYAQRYPVGDNTGTTTTPPTNDTGGVTPTPSPPLTTSPPLTPQEQDQQTHLQNVIAATNLNLDEAEKQVGGVVYTPRWSDPVWVEPDSAAVLIAYCLPGEFAESGQEILGGFELEVLESYEVALPQNFTAWMMVIGNEDRQDRLPAAVGVICASDANDAETRVLSPDEEQQINNIISQITQVTSIDQVINIINRNNNATTTPTTPPPTTTTTTPSLPGPEPPECPSGYTFNPDTDRCERTQQVAPQCPSVSGLEGFQFDPDTDRCFHPLAPAIPPVAPQCPEGFTFNPATNQCEQTQIAAPQCPEGFTFNPATNQCEQAVTSPPPPSQDTTGPTLTVPNNMVVETNNSTGTSVTYNVGAVDNVDGEAVLESDIIRQDNVGGSITIACDPPSGSTFPIGVTTVECTATDAAGNRGTASFTVTVNRGDFKPLIEEQPLIEEEGAAPPAAEEEQPPEETTEEEGAGVDGGGDGTDDGGGEPPAATTDEGGGL
jgi:hypothetical protein